MMTKANDLIFEMVSMTLDDAESRNSSNILPFAQPQNTIEFDYYLDEDRKCFVLDIRGLSIDIPMNWGPFKHRISHEFYIDHSEDTDHFLEIISDVYGETIEVAKFKRLDISHDKLVA